MKPNINSLRRKHSGVLKDRETLVQAALDAGRPLTPEETVKDDGLKLEAESLANTITRAEALERELAASALPVDADEPAAPVRVRVSEVQRPKGHNFAACMLAIAGAHLRTRQDSRLMTPAQFAKEVLHNEIAAASLTASSLAGGGALIREDVSADFIELLGASSIVRRAGANIVPMPNGQLTMNGLAGGATASWVGENVSPNASAQTLRQIKLSAKKLRCIVPISNDLLRFAGDSVLQMVLNDMLQTMALAEDLAFLRGAGTAYTPKGMKNWAGNTNPAQGSPDLTKVTTDSGKAILNLMEDNVPFRKVFWAWAPRTSVYLENQRDSNGNKAWPEIERSTFRRYPFFETTQIPTNLGGGSNESEIYLADAADLIIGQAPVIGAKVYSEGSYQDSSGTVVSPTVRDETVVDMIEEVDFATRHVESINLTTAVIWTV